MKRTLAPHALVYAALIVLLSAGTAVGAAGHDTIFSNDIAEGEVHSSDIDNDTIRGKDVKNNSLTGKDIDESTLNLSGPGGANGATGPAGPQGPAGPGNAFFARVLINGDLDSGSPGVSANKPVGSNIYRVSFPSNVATCGATVTVKAPITELLIPLTSFDSAVVEVSFSNVNGDVGTAAFSLIVVCP